MESKKLLIFVGVALAVVLIGFGAFAYTASQNNEPRITSLTFEEQECAMYASDTRHTYCYFCATVEVGFGSQKTIICNGGPSADLYIGDKYLGKIYAEDKKYRIFDGGRQLMYFSLDDYFTGSVTAGKYYTLKSTGERVLISSVHYEIDPYSLPSGWTDHMSDDCVVKVV